MLDRVKERLESFGIPPDELEETVLQFCFDKVENKIRNFCHIAEIPEALTEVEVEMICGEYLFTKKSLGQLKLEYLDLEAAAKQIQMGDTNVTFRTDGTSTPEQRLDILISSLLDHSRDLEGFRCIPW